MFLHTVSYSKVNLEKKTFFFLRTARRKEEDLEREERIRIT